MNNKYVAYGLMAVGALIHWASYNNMFLIGASIMIVAGMFIIRKETAIVRCLSIGLIPLGIVWAVWNFVAMHQFASLLFAQFSLTLAGFAGFGVLKYEESKEGEILAAQGITSVKKEYSNIKNDDGTVSIKFKSYVRAPSIVTFMSVILAFIIAFVMSLYFGQNTDWGIRAIVGLVSGVVVFGSFIVVGKAVRTRYETITIRPNQGVAFKGKFINFSDIESLGVTTRTHSGPNFFEEHHFVHMNVGGKALHVTNLMPMALADSISGTLQSYR